MQECPSGGKRALFHVSSAGEYLQARPLMLALKKRYPDLCLILSFFSISLEDQLAKNPAADVETYLPFDTPGSMKRFLDITRPGLVVFSTYDVWPNLLFLCRDRGIPAIMANGTLSAASSRILPAARWFFGSLYSMLDCIGAISENDAQRFRSLGVPSDKIDVTGNCRYEQTMERAANVSASDPVLANIPAGRGALVAGSTWPEDEAVILPAFYRLASEFPEMLLILAPHEPLEKRLRELEKDFAAHGLETARLSVISKSEGKNSRPRVVLVDTVGDLFKLYSKGGLAYVGGGFGKAVHNVMEPAAFGLPVLFGPKHHNSQEALLMKETGGAFEVEGSADLEERLRGFLKNEGSRSEAGALARKTVEDNSGATERTVEFIERRVSDFFK